MVGWRPHLGRPPTHLQRRASEDLPARRTDRFNPRIKLVVQLQASTTALRCFAPTLMELSIRSTLTGTLVAAMGSRWQAKRPVNEYKITRYRPSQLQEICGIIIPPCPSQSKKPSPRPLPGHRPSNRSVRQHPSSGERGGNAADYGAAANEAPGSAVRAVGPRRCGSSRKSVS